MNKEEFFKRFAENAGAGRATQQIVRLKTDLSDGILHRESQATALCDGILQSVTSVEIGILACGHRGEVGLLCRHVDEDCPEPHYVCASCMTVCSSCHGNICAHHAVETDDGVLCPDCARTASLECIVTSAAGWIGRLLE